MSLGSVLILDENQAQAQAVSRLLHQQKWSSVLSFDQKQAMRILKSTRFQLLLFEAYVDGNSTLQAFGEIRSSAENTPLAIMADGYYGEKALKATLAMAKQTGADFTLSKPFTPEKVKTLIQETNTYHRMRRTEQHVLVIEDDADLRAHLCAVLKQVGYTVSSAANVEDVFFDHNLGVVDVVLTAILIQGIGGIEGTAQIRKDFPHIHVIAMSQGVSDTIGPQHVLAAATEAGAEATLPKPFTMGEMLRAVAHVLKKKHEGEDDPDPQSDPAVTSDLIQKTE
ncbi:MAG TPA: response regulator [Asticcacaulis sp.]|nr:response regulator [Asticcacaulis sp.]